jgi:branched-chain amino acid transport system substrate-binding protein
MLALYRKDTLDPQWASAPDNVAYRAFMAKYMPQANLAEETHAYAYAVGHTLIEVLKRAGDDLRRENIMKQAANLKGLEVPMLLPGIKVNTSATDFYPLQAVRMARVKGKGFELFGDILSQESD